MERDSAGAWVSLRDYLVKGVRKDSRWVASRVEEPSAIPVPRTWISAADYWGGGVRKARVQPSLEDFLVHLRPPPEKKAIPPEAWWTVYDTLAGVYAVLSDSAMVPKIEAMRANYRQDFDSGHLSDEEQQHRNVVLDEIISGHFARMDAIVAWYVDTFFRVLEPGLHEASVGPKA